MIFFNIICLILVFKYSSGEQPQSSCSENYPFRLNDFSCADFSHICLKSGDEQCNVLLNACKQCPPNKITVTILRDILEFVKKIPNTTKLSDILESTKNSSSLIVENRNFGNMCSILLIISLGTICILFLETRFKIITKCIQNCFRKEKSKYAFLRSRKFSVQNKQSTELQFQFKELNEKINLKFQELKDMIDLIPKPFSNIQYATIQFQFQGTQQKPMELYVHNNHNVVQVKQQICAKLPHAKQDDYKILKVKYDGTILDDNEYLLKHINSSNTIIICVFDSAINASDIVVVKLQGKMRVPDIIQINKHQNFAQLKEIIGKIINSYDISIFKENIEMKELIQLKDENSVVNLTDGDWIRVVTKEVGKLIIKSIFDDDVSITSNYFNTDLISSLTTSVANKFNSTAENFVLFCDNKYLDENKFIFEYEIGIESPVKFCCFEKYSGIMQDNKCIEKGVFWELYNANDTKTNKKILIKKYNLKLSKNWKNDDFALKELNTFEITKSHKRFIQLFGVFNDDVSLYVSMENMTGGTMKTFLKKRKRLKKDLNQNDIYKWSAQILEGLKYLHERKVIHRDLNPSSILVDGNDDLKLSSFNLSKYENSCAPCSIMNNYGSISVMEKTNQPSQLKVRYMAPEILTSEKYGVQCDVWSFGAILIRIVSGKKPYPKLSKEEAKNKIKNSRNIEYEFSDKFLDIGFKSFIDSCVKSEPDQREKIENLIKNKFIEKYL